MDKQTRNALEHERKTLLRERRWLDSCTERWWASSYARLLVSNRLAELRVLLQEAADEQA